MELWHDIVNQYSLCDLTRPDDCFPAMAGLAEQMKLMGRTGDYFAGLFMDTLLFDLSWNGGLRNLCPDSSAPIRREGGISSRDLPAEYASLVRRAPSWSWGSAMRPHYLVDRGADYVRKFATIKDAMFVTRSSDLHVDPSSMLTIEAPTVPLKVELVSEAFKEAKPANAHVLTMADALRGPGYSMEISTFKPKSFGFVVWLDRPIFFEPDRLEHGDIVYLLRIGAWSDQEEGESYGNLYEFCMLVKMMDGPHPISRRIRCVRKIATTDAERLFEGAEIREFSIQ